MLVNQINLINLHLNESAAEAERLADTIAAMRKDVNEALSNITVRLQRDVANLSDMEQALRRWATSTTAVADPEFVSPASV